MSFPYQGKTRFNSPEPSLQELAEAQNRVENLLLGMVTPDHSVSLIARFDGDLSGHPGRQGQGSDALRFGPGPFRDSMSVQLEGSSENLLSNPSMESDLVGWYAADPSLEISRDPSVACREGGIFSDASLRLQGTGKPGAGQVQTSAAVNPGTNYSASVYLHPEGEVQVRLELAFTGGGTPVSYSSSDLSVPPGTWTRLLLENKNSGDNTACEFRLHLLGEAPTFTPGSRLSRMAPTASAPVDDTSMALSAGDLVLCAVTTESEGQGDYAWQVVTTGGNGVSDPNLRLNHANEPPLFANQSRLSRWNPAAALPGDDNTTTLDVGDMVFCCLEGGEYSMHIVTSAGTAASTTLRLDDGPATPVFIPGSLLSRYIPSATALEDDQAMTLVAGDLVLCHCLEEPFGEGYGWHMVTTGGTGVADPALRLDDAQGPPNLAGGSRVSKFTPGGSELATGNALVLEAGNFVFCSLDAGYGWHMVTTGATGASSPDLRLDQAFFQNLHADCAQLEPASSASSYLDEVQGPGHFGQLGFPTHREGSLLFFETGGILQGSEGTVAFWMRPGWAGNDSVEHVLFDAAESSGRNRLRFSKSRENRLVLSLYDDDAQLLQLVSDSPVSFPAETWVHLAFIYSSGTLGLYLDGQKVTASKLGSGLGGMMPTPERFYLGTDFQGHLTGRVAFAGLVVKRHPAPDSELAAMARLDSPYQGLALAQGAFTMGAGRSSTAPTPGVQSTILHGLGKPPTFVQISERGEGLVYLSDDADDFHFYVKGTASSVSFDWRAWA
ncbi:MAG: LamG-like jellyroll fold domain-containing protein [Candidatus Xenobium sp.]|jgi:hypothetical protein|nr:hypothetical protein [Burkholderiales bacterium]